MLFPHVTAAADLVAEPVLIEPKRTFATESEHSFARTPDPARRSLTSLSLSHRAADACFEYGSEGIDLWT